MILLKRKVANSAKIKKNKHTIESPFPTAGSENINVSISFCIPYKLLNILRYFVILKILKILAIEGKTCKTVDPEEATPE